MFSQDEQKYTAVILVTSDGTTLEGEIRCGLDGSVISALNNDGQFIQFRDVNGEASFLAKSSIMKLAPRNNGAKPAPVLKVDRSNTGDWTKVLHVEQGATSDEVRHAYHELARAYHPDMYSIDVPIEIKQYASAMLSRINVAYEQYKLFRKAA